MARLNGGEIDLARRVCSNGVASLRVSIDSACAVAFGHLTAKRRGSSALLAGLEGRFGQV